jgi:8-hydroxy-5-deazaflavin:NADPH oxidoreductase
MARQLAAELRPSAVPWTRSVVTGEKVVSALPYPAALSIAAEVKTALQGKVAVDVCSPSNSASTGVATPPNSSAA